jgi:Ca-activated chloride channel homolog
MQSAQHSPRKITIRRITTVLAGTVLTILCVFRPGCAVSTDFAGATAGGAQDIAFARQTIDSGGIPTPESITVEGFISEHSIETETPEDAGLLYATATAAWNDDFDTLTPLVTVAVGFGTTVVRGTFEREPQNICLVIDRSGSMGDPMDVRTGTSKLTAVKVAIDRLLAQLNADDRVSIVSFTNAPQVILEPVPGDSFVEVKQALDRLEADGSTDVARGMRSGMQLVQNNSDPSRADRILVFTDANISTGTRDSDDILAVMKNFAAGGIGTSIFGVGFNFDSDLAFDISQVRGGNYFFINDFERMVSLFDEEFDYMVTPLAYDVALTATIPFTFDVQDVYGMPVQDPFTHVLDLNIPTLFLSAREGGGVILIRLRPSAVTDMTAENPVADIALEFQTPEGEPGSDSISVTLPSGLSPSAEESYYETAGTQRAVLLLNTALVLQAAASDAYYSRYHWRSDNQGTTETAAARLREFLPVFDAMADGLPDRARTTSRALSEERALLEQLLVNITGENPSPVTPTTP